MANFSEKVSQVHNDKLDQHLMANVDIEPGETLLEERPLLVVPHWDCEQMKCAQCMKESYRMCKKCQVFPLCLDCLAHDAYECTFFSTGPGGSLTKNLLVKNYPIWAVLKLLVLMEQTATKAACAVLNSLNINFDYYRDSQNWQNHDEQIVTPLLQAGVAKVFSTKIDAALLHKICVSIDRHSFELSTRDGDMLKGVYVHGTQLPHHCIPNVAVALDDDFNMKLYAAVPIRAGDIIYNSYADPLMGTSQRQHQLRLSRHLDCKCTRCLDPTELGTHMSSIKCHQCAHGYALCMIDSLGDWQCRVCNAITPAIEVHKLLAEVGEAMVNAEGKLPIYETLLAKYSSVLHPNHFLLLDIKNNIAIILRAAIIANSMHDSSKRLLSRRVQLCQELLPVTRTVVPGISKLYAIALFEYMLGFLELAELEFRYVELSKEEYKQKLEMAKSFTTEALDLLLYEPTNSPEGYMAHRISKEQQRIEKELKKCSNK